MDRWFALLLLACTVPAQAQVVNRDKLREVVYVPLPSFDYHIDTNFEIAVKKPSLEAALARVQADEGNPENHLVLADVYPSEQKEKQTACYRRVVELLEGQVKHPDCSGWELAMYGRALLKLDRVEEATAFCQKATAVASKDFRTWRELLHTEHRRAGLALSKGGTLAVHLNRGPDGWNVTGTQIQPDQAAEAAQHVVAWLILRTLQLDDESNPYLNAALKALE